MKRLGAWVALLAIGLHAVWPLLANAKVGAEPFYTLVCTDHGTLAVPAGDAPGKPDSKHCDFCPVGCTPVATPSGVSLFEEFSFLTVEAANPPFVIRFVLSPLSARAPPHLS